MIDLDEIIELENKRDGAFKWKEILGGPEGL